MQHHLRILGLLAQPGHQCVPETLLELGSSLHRHCRIHSVPLPDEMALPVFQIDSLLASKLCGQLVQREETTPFQWDYVLCGRDEEGEEEEAEEWKVRHFHKHSYYPFPFPQ